MIAIMAETNNASDHSLLWGYPIEVWDSLGIRALIWGAALGVLALLLTAASAYILYRVADVAQKGLETESKSSAEKIAELTVRSDQLRKDTAEANARAAEAQAKLAEVEERNEKRAMPRGMLVTSLAHCREVLKGKPKGKVEILWLKAFTDGQTLAFFLSTCFHAPPDQERWTVLDVRSIDELPEEADSSGGITVIGQRRGFFPFKRPSDVLSDTVANALTAALDTSLIHIGVGTDPSMPDDLVKVVIGEK